jgi:hypothetical protein
MLWLYSLRSYGIISYNLYVCGCRIMDWILDVAVVFLGLFELCYGIELYIYDDVTMFVLTMSCVCINIYILSYCPSGFTTLPSVPLQEQPVVVLLLEGHRSLGELAIREYGRHKDLRGSGRRSVIPYVHGWMELYCWVLVLDWGVRCSPSVSPCVYVEFIPGLRLCDCRLPGPFIPQGRAVTGRPHGPTGGPRAGRPLRS